MLSISSAGVITVPDAGLLDLSAILHNDSAAQGIKLPQSTSLTAIAGQEGYIAYDTDDNLADFVLRLTVARDPQTSASPPEP